MSHPSEVYLIKHSLCSQVLVHLLIVVNNVGFRTGYWQPWLLTAAVAKPHKGLGKAVFQITASFHNVFK